MEPRGKSFTIVPRPLAAAVLGLAAQRESDALAGPRRVSPSTAPVDTFDLELLDTEDPETARRPTKHDRRTLPCPPPTAATTRTPRRCAGSRRAAQGSLADDGWPFDPAAGICDMDGNEVAADGTDLACASNSCGHDSDCN